jgi:hypothetical protein
MRCVCSIAALSFALAGAVPVFGQNAATNLDTVYRDETHCLVLPEVRGDADGPLSCFCRDTLVDARYVNQTYLLTGKDRNLTGIFLSLLARGQDVCGKDYNVSSVTDARNWQWNGPEVRRVYPADSVIEQIKPDARGLRAVQYDVQLTYRTRQGGVANVERFKATDQLPADFKTRPCPVSAVCPK